MHGDVPTYTMIAKRNINTTLDLPEKRNAQHDGYSSNVNLKLMIWGTYSVCKVVHLSKTLKETRTKIAGEDDWGRDQFPAEKDKENP